MRSMPRRNSRFPSRTLRPIFMRRRKPSPTHTPSLPRAPQAVPTAPGLPAYEISNHAMPGAESRHNLTYWRYGEYVGVGPGAHGRFIENGHRTVTIAERTPESRGNSGRG